jgi:excisionase family DNA binding protein
MTAQKPYSWQNWSELPLLMTVEEVAALLRCNPRTITRKIDRGELRASKPAGAWLIRREDVLELAGVESNVLHQPLPVVA